MSSWHSSRRDSQRVLELQSSDSEDEKFAGQISLVRSPRSRVLAFSNIAIAP